MKKHKQRLTRNIILEHIKTNIRDYAILFAFFLIGVLLGIFLINHTSDNQKQEITSYVNTYITSFKTSENVNYISLLKDSLTKNILFAIVIWAIGASVTLAPLVNGAICFKGFCLGYTISSAMAFLGVGKGILFSITLLLLQNIIVIPTLIAIALSGIKLHEKIVKKTDVRDRNKHGKENIKLEILRHSFFSLIMICIIALSSFVEVYISTNLFAIVVQFF